MALDELGHLPDGRRLNLTLDAGDVDAVFLALGRGQGQGLAGLGIIRDLAALRARLRDGGGDRLEGEG